MFEKLRKFFTHGFRDPREGQRLVLKDDGVTLFADEREVWSFRWDEVSCVETYKCDLWAYDMICLDFSVVSREATYRTDEEMEGFDSLCGQLCRRFPAIADDWLLLVASPAFAQNRRVLFVKPIP